MKRTLLAKIAVGTISLLVPLAIVAVAVVGARFLIAGRKEPPRTEREARPTFVEVLAVEAQARPVTLSAFGTVQAHREVTVQAQVAGRVVEQHEKLLRGGILMKGDVLVRIDPRDYKLAVQQEDATLAKARFDLKVEEGRQVVASREWTLLESSIERNPLSEELALRKPHLEEKKAQVRAAESRLERARIDFERTELRAPFNSVALEESVEVGQLVSSQSIIARLVCIDEFHVEASIALSDLRWVRVPGRGGPSGSRARIVYDVGGGRKATREGEVVRLLADVDPTGRRARVLVAVTDPLGVLTQTHLDAPLLVGEWVKVEIEGPEIEDAVLIPRPAVRADGRIWVRTAAGTLAVRAVESLFKTEEHEFVRNSFEAGDEIITSALEVAIPGMALVTVDTLSTPAAEAVEDPDV